MGIANCVGGGGELNALNKALWGGLPLACLSMQYNLWKIFILRYRLIQPWLVLRVFQCSEDVIKNMYLRSTRNIIWALWRLTSPITRPLFNSLFLVTTNSSKLRITELCGGNSSANSDFPSQRTSIMWKACLCWCDTIMNIMDLTAIASMSKV